MPYLSRTLPSFGLTTRAALATLLSSTGLLAGALLFEHAGGLAPCEMCMWQRWPHLAAMILSLVALLPIHIGLRRILATSAAGGMTTSGSIAIYHLGVERHWWAGHTACTASIPKGLAADEVLQKIMNMPIHRCDVPQWTAGGLSLADLNAVFSLSIAALVIWKLFGGKHPPETLEGN